MEELLSIEQNTTLSRLRSLYMRAVPFARNASISTSLSGELLLVFSSDIIIIHLFREGYSEMRGWAVIYPPRNRKGYSDPEAEPRRCHLLRGGLAQAPRLLDGGYLRDPGGGGALALCAFPPGEVSRGRGGAGPRGEVLAGPRRGAEARRLCCFGERAAAATAVSTKIVAVTATGTGAALGEQQRGRWPLAPLRRGRPGAERSSCATGGIVCPGVHEPVPRERRGRAQGAGWLQQGRLPSPGFRLLSTERRPEWKPSPNMTSKLLLTTS
ncbi:uncharacterized protein LOC125918111 [Panthera uncia]|uniref:uncharacterized protein LOC125917231 n=1 Tax=Panthera uncia TaxID=29064 RepID=UPI0020FFA3BB|nr:uncharacterized protein LOC125917231 [Panthera uncia]XP_049480110.1 uncharacterized protein LOC125918111 [Panthera uncia]